MWVLARVFFLLENLDEAFHAGANQLKLMDGLCDVVKAFCQKYAKDCQLELALLDELCGLLIQKSKEAFF